MRKHLRFLKNRFEDYTYNASTVDAPAIKLFIVRVFMLSTLITTQGVMLSAVAVAILWPISEQASAEFAALIFSICVASLFTLFVIVDLAIIRNWDDFQKAFHYPEEEEDTEAEVCRPELKY